MASNLKIQESPADKCVVFGVYLSEDKVEVLLDCPDPLTSIELNVNLILGEFDRLDLPKYPDKKTLEKILRTAVGPDEDLVGKILIQGTQPEPTIHGNVQWSREYFAEGWVVDEKTDTINFREKVENCSVRKNELLARKSDPREGVAGIDVFGNQIPVDKPEASTLRCGKGVVEVTGTEMTSYFADLTGRIHFKDNIISVDEVFAIHGDVDLKSGNIHHTGSITVDGDIRNGATVEAEGDILVKGMIEQSDIKCGGTLTVAGGIIGDEDHRIEVGGKVEAKYIREAHLTANCDVLVSREISHSTVRSQGSVLVPNGRIAGGITTALKGIRVATAGAPGSTDTLLQTGIDFALEARIELSLEKIAHLETTIGPIQAALRNAEQATGEKSSSAGTVIEELSERQMLIGRAITTEYMRIEELTRNTDQEARFFVVMNKEVWSGTTIHLGQNITIVKRSINKPRIALLKEDRARVYPLGESNMPPED